MEVPPISVVIYCEQARDLLNAFSVAVSEVIRLHEEQFQAVIHGDENIERFENLIHLANERKGEAKYAYLAHREAHGCSRIMRDDLKRNG